MDSLFIYKAYQPCMSTKLNNLYETSTSIKTNIVGYNPMHPDTIPFIKKRNDLIYYLGE